MALIRRILHPDGGDNYTTDDCFNYCVDPPPCDRCLQPLPSPQIFPPKMMFSPPPLTSTLVDVNVKTPLILHKHKHLTLIAEVIFSVLVTFFLLLTCYVLFLRLRAHFRRRRAAAAIINTPGGSGPSPDEDEGEDAAFFNPDNGGVHHVWFIRTVGLEQPMINSITVSPYKRGDGLIESTDCSVCLSEFQEGELVRLLPKCCHAFHLPCIDTWLRSHLNCPLCRAPIVAPVLPPQAPGEATASSAAVAAAVIPDSTLSAAAVVVVSESADADSDDAGSVRDEQQSIPSSRIIFAVPEDREETGIYEDSSSGSGTNPPPSPLPPVASLSVAQLGFRLRSDLGGCMIRQHLSNNDEWVTVDLGPVHGTQPVRRSVSMDLSAMRALFHRREEEEEQSNDNSVGSVSGRKAKLLPCLREVQPAATAAGMSMMKHGGDLKVGDRNLQKQALGIERSSSGNSSGGYIFSRLGRDRTRNPASILPL